MTIDTSTTAQPDNGRIEPDEREVEETPLLILRPATGWQVLDFREIWRYRDLLLALAARDVKLRYRQTALGATWVVLQPLIAAALFAFVFGRVARLPSDGVPYFVFSYAGLLAWNIFNGTLTKASVSLVQNSQLISKVYFPRIIVPVSTVFSSLVDFAVALVMMAAIMAWNRVIPSFSILLLPIWLILILMLSVGCGLFCAALMVTYRDVQYVVPVITQFLMYASPVAYSITAVPVHLRVLYQLNPLSGILEAFRWSLLGKGHLDGWAITSSVFFSFAALLGGAAYLRNTERRFADVI